MSRRNVNALVNSLAAAGRARKAAELTTEVITEVEVPTELTTEAEVNVEIETTPATSFAQFCRDSGMNPKTARAKLRRYKVAKETNDGRNYSTDALIRLNADLAARKAALAAPEA